MIMILQYLVINVLLFVSLFQINVIKISYIHFCWDWDAPIDFPMKLQGELVISRHFCRMPPDIYVLGGGGPDKQSKRHEIGPTIYRIDPVSHNQCTYLYIRVCTDASIHIQYRLYNIHIYNYIYIYIYLFFPCVCN